jgi:hypothetical protein
MMIRKPAHGEPCTRCGVCCYAVLCPLGKHVFGSDRTGPCPALSVDDDHTAHCLLTEFGEVRMRAAAALLIGAGDGCDARFNGEPANSRFHAKLERLDQLRAEELAAARKLWEMEE